MTLDKILWVIEKSYIIGKKVYNRFKPKEESHPLTFKEVQHIQNQINDAVRKSREEKVDR